MVKIVADNNEKVLVDPAIILKGKDGLDGKDGERGPEGLPGRDGKDGKDGRDGIDGKDGKDGFSFWLEYDKKKNELVFKNNGGMKNPDPIKLPAAAKGWGFSAGSGKGGVTAQADWNQTDPHAVDYIKNKPKNVISLKRVDVLPDEGETNTLYLVPADDEEENNIYDEYIWAAQPDGTYAWEKIGTTEIKGFASASDLIPDFDSLTPIETHTFDMSSTGYHEIFSRPNDADTFDNPTDAQFEVWCRITTTNKEGTSTNPRIYQELDCVFREFGSSTQVIYGVIRSKPESVTAATTGIQTLRSVCPKAINSGKQWAVEVKPYNSTARTVTVKVYKTATGISWKDTDVISTYDTNHQTSVSVNAYNSPGYLFLGPITGTISSASNASTAGYITGSLQKTLASSTLKNTGYVITGNSLLFKIKGQALLSGIAETNAPIDVDFGICQAGTTTAATSTSTYAYTNFYQKHQFTPASSVNFAEAYDNGDLIYARFTLSNGNLYSDNICSKYPTAGHTWYLIGMATSSSAINFDNTESYFFTLNDEGKLTHINGKKISTRNIVTDTSSSSITLANAEGGVDYHYGTITSLTVTANDTSADETNIYFTAGSSISVSLPNTLKFIGSTPTFSPNKQYVLSIANNILISGEVS